MNCDQVFDILTRGPFPTGTECDAGVEAHLAACPECRRLAEALRPAIELFQEAIGPEESRDLPGYWCAVAADRTQPVVSYAEDREPPRTPPPAVVHAPASGWSALAMWRMAAVLALGVTVGSLLHSRVSLDGFSTVPPTTGGAALIPPADESPQRGALTPALRARLAVLPAACTRNQPGKGPRYTERGDQMLATADLTRLICCAECHHRSSPAVPRSATSLVIESCQICHND